MTIAQNIIKIRKETKNIPIVAVTKTRSIGEIKEAIDAGIRIIGENKVQEAEQKHGILKDYLKRNKIEFHFIGHLQSNKVKKAVELFDMIQSVDSLKIAVEIDKRANEIDKIQDIMIQVNIGREKQKFGAMPGEVLELIDEIKRLKNIRLAGLMCIHPYSDDPENSRHYFKDMKNIFDKTKLKYLSMGTTNDYKIAIEEGANMVRIGRGLFEERKY